MNRAWIELDSAALKHNLEELSKEFDPKTGIMGVVKANGYGHGATQIAAKLNEFGIDHICVAALSEAIELREAGIKGTIIILGYTAPGFAMELYRNQITQTLVSIEYAKQLDEVFGQMIEATMPEKKDAKLLANMAIDTGMHRIGVTDENRNKKSRRGEKKNGTQLPTDKPALSCSPAEEIERLREEMKQCAKELRFEEAAFRRDKSRELEKAAGQGSPAGK